MAKMASILKNMVLPNRKVWSKTCVLFANAVRSHSNYQYKPGPYPKTQAERDAAAKKYGLVPEAYQPYPEDEGFGDYPKMPDISGDSKDPFYPYDMPELKRNFGETYHASSEMIGEDRYDISARHRIPLWEQWIWFLGVMFGTYGLYTYLENYKMGRPVLAKQFPGRGTHYNFEG